VVQCASPGPGRQLGQLLSMSFNAVSRSFWPLTQATMPFQKLPEPTAPGIWSEPSNRKTVACCPSCAICWVSWDL